MRTEFSARDGALRCINVINFIRGVEPRFETDLLLPVQKQMELVVENDLPATWLLQYDALVDPRFTDYLKAHMASKHEVGFWFEMNKKLCDAAGVAWRGRPGYEWDHFPPIAFTIGYTPAERILLADAAMRDFKAIWGKFPASIASWNLDSITLEHLSSNYPVDAYAVCRDQIATDGFTIWGAPIAGYYPSKLNCWSPALSKSNQIDTPIFRMLGQDPVHYYSRNYKRPDGKVLSEPDTMEPVWYAGRSEHFIHDFLEMIATAPTLKFGYAQLGQENSFPWQEMSQAYPIQIKALAALKATGKVHVETMGESGRRFKKAFRTTPTQAQVMLDDPFGNTEPSEGSIWYQSRFYRADLHLAGDLPYLRDLTVYSDHNPQPFLNEATRLNDVEQRMPSVLDGYHWSRKSESPEQPGAGGYFEVAGKRLKLAGRPVVREQHDTLIAELPMEGGRVLTLQFEERTVTMKLRSVSESDFSLHFEWDPSKAALKGVNPNAALFSWKGFDYKVNVTSGHAQESENGWLVGANRNEIILELAQSS